MSGDERDAAARKRSRATWPIASHPLSEDPSDDLSQTTTAAQRVAMMAELADAAWQIAGRSLPTYDRRTIPGRLFRPGEPRPVDDDA